MVLFTSAGAVDLTSSNVVPYELMKANLLTDSYTGLTGLVCLDKSGDRSANYEILNKDNFQYTGVGGWNVKLVPALGKCIIVGVSCSVSIFESVISCSKFRFS